MYDCGSECGQLNKTVHLCTDVCVNVCVYNLRPVLSYIHVQPFSISDLGLIAIMSKEGVM